MLFTPNRMLLTDTYKFSHWKMFPPDTEYNYYYMEARTEKKVMWYGLQPILTTLRFLSSGYERVVEARNIVNLHVGRGVLIINNGLDCRRNIKRLYLLELWRCRKDIFYQVVLF